LRAIGFHALKRQIFLPMDVMQAEGLSAEDVFAFHNCPALRRVIQVLAGQAQMHLDAVGKVLPRPSRQALPALLPVTLARAYLKQIARSDYDPFAVQAPIPAFRRQSRLIWAMARRRL